MAAAFPISLFGSAWRAVSLSHNREMKSKRNGFSFSAAAEVGERFQPPEATGRENSPLFFELDSGLDNRNRVRMPSLESVFLARMPKKHLHLFDAVWEKRGRWGAVPIYHVLASPDLPVDICLAFFRACRFGHLFGRRGFGRALASRCNLGCQRESEFGVIFLSVLLVSV